jgi:hypothetical protein
VLKDEVEPNSSYVFPAAPIIADVSIDDRECKSISHCLAELLAKAIVEWLSENELKYIDGCPHKLQ